MSCIKYESTKSSFFTKNIKYKLLFIISIAK